MANIILESVCNDLLIRLDKVTGISKFDCGGEDGYNSTIMFLGINSDREVKWVYTSEEYDVFKLEYASVVKAFKGQDKHDNEFDTF